MGLFLGSSLISPVQLQQVDASRDWRYTTLANGTKLLELYMRKDDDVQVLDDNTVINTGCFRSDLYVKNIDLMQVPYYNNDMSQGFYYDYNLTSVANINQNTVNMCETFFRCNSLVNVSEIPNNVTNMYNTFYGCSNLKSSIVIPSSVSNLRRTFDECSNLTTCPDIRNCSNVTSLNGTFNGCSNITNCSGLPNNVIDMSYTFSRCYKLENAPVIPNSVTNMMETFAGCGALVNVSEIPDSVTLLVSTFAGCSKLENAPIIGNGITDISYAFQYCSNLVGDIIIRSPYIKSAQGCFIGTSLSKNVYIPFKYNDIEENMYAWYSSIAYVSNYPDVLYTKTESPLANTEGQVFYANGESFTISNINTTSANTYIDFGGYGLNYSRNVQNDIINGNNTLTYNSFSQHYGSGQNGVTLFDINELNQ